jgi:hypothetical protein
VARYVLAGVDENTIARCLNIRPGQLREHYAAELDNSKADIDAAVAASIVNMAIGSKETAPEPSMARFYAKARMGWKDGDTNAPPVSPLNIIIHI